MTVAYPPAPDDVDAGVPWHYGDPFAEQRALAAGTGAVDCSHREVIEVSGADRRALLDALTSQRVAEMQPGESAYDLLLDPHGRIEAELHLVALDDRVLITTEPGNAAGVAAFLDRMRFRMQAEIRIVTDDWAVVWEPVRALHDDLPAILSPELYAGLPLPDAGADVSNYVAPQDERFAGREILVPRQALADYLAAQPTLAGTWAWNALRIAAGMPRFGVETDERSIPHELGWLGTAVHMKKGCYRGQETVAKVHTAARPPRRLVLLHLDGSTDVLPEHGAPVQFEDATVGFIGMSVQHHELGPIASAVVKRSVGTDVELDVSGMRATQHVIVQPETAGSARGPVGPVRMRMLGHR